MFNNPPHHLQFGATPHHLQFGATPQHLQFGVAPQQQQLFGIAPRYQQQLGAPLQHQQQFGAPLQQMLFGLAQQQGTPPGGTLRDRVQERGMGGRSVSGQPNANMGLLTCIVNGYDVNGMPCTTTYYVRH